MRSDKGDVDSMEFVLTHENETVDLSEAIKQLETNNVDTSPLILLLEEDT